MTDTEKTLVDHAAHHAGKERTASASAPKCGATRTASGKQHVCAKASSHKGDHKADAFTWRRSSGDHD